MAKMKSAETLIAAIGWLTMVAAFVKFLYITSVYLRPSKLNKYAHCSAKDDSPWALVTGASDGIGRELARQLASEGFNVVLHGRDLEKLSRVIAELQQDHPARLFRLVVADASLVPCMSCLEQQRQEAADDAGAAKPGLPVDFASIRESLDDIYLTVLINNAGGSLPKPQFLLLNESPQSRTTSNVSLNALFPLHLTRELLPVLIRNGPSLVINISSLSDEGFPLLTPYSASKQFLMTMTRSIGLEMALSGNKNQVEFLGVRVGKVTGVSGLKDQPSFFCPDASTMARAVLDRVGWQHGIVVGYWAHALQSFCFAVLPIWLRNRVVMTAMEQERGKYESRQKHAKEA